MSDLADLADRVDALAVETGFAGAVSVTEGESRTFATAHGLADRARRIPNTVDTRFGIASGTKSFTALTVMRLVESGLLDLDTTARSVLGADLPLVDDAVTIEQLLAHRSGIGDYFDEEANDLEDYVLNVPLHTLESIEAWLPVLHGHPMVTTPGTTFAYNNGGYVLLALVAERVSNIPFPALLDELVVMPAGLTATGFARSDTPEPDLAIGYVDELGLDRTNVLHQPVLGGGDGGLASTLADIDRFWRALFTGGIATAATVADMTRDRSEITGPDNRYGLGFWLAPDGMGDAVILEGCDAGISFRSVHEPGAVRTRTVIGNTTDGAWPISKLLTELLN